MTTMVHPGRSSGALRRTKKATAEPGGLWTCPHGTCGSTVASGLVATSNFLNFYSPPRLLFPPPFFISFTPELQALSRNTKPRSQRRSASAAFHHKTLKYESFLPCKSFSSLMPGVPAMPWHCCWGGSRSHP